MGVCEHFGVRQLVQKELIRTIFKAKKNEVFGGDSTHGRAPPAVLAALCCNLPISSTERKPRAKSTKNIWNSEGENELPTFSQIHLNGKVGKLLSIAQQWQMF